MSKIIVFDGFQFYISLRLPSRCPTRYLSRCTNPLFFIPLMNYYGSLVLLSVAIALLRLSHKILSLWQRRHLPFPPGPASYPVIGNLWDLPAKVAWLTYAEWGRQYGSELVHASALGQHIVVVNSVKAANELFEQRSHIYSDRPVVTMVELMGWDFNMGLMRIGDRWRKHRRMFQQHFRRDMARNYRPVQMKKIHQLLRALLSSPQEFREHLKTLTAAIIMATVYGYDVQSRNDHFVTLVERAITKLSEAFFPGAAAVNMFPVLRYLPSWMPGAGFQRFATESRKLSKEMREVPFNFVKQNMSDGLDSTSMVARLLVENQARGRHDEGAIQEVAAVAYAAGADTTVSALATFFLAMAIHPDIQKKAQTEIDAVVGTHRLPEFEDRPSLPFVEAVFREVIRWKPVVPLGVAHASTADDIYNGYFIPKGTTVISNIWAMTRDESIYPEPERFNPDRFYTADGKLTDDEVVFAFGSDLVIHRFGRRICVGRHVADASLWGTIVSVLSTFNVAKPRDGTGKEIDIDPRYSDGMISHPGPFECSIIPRSETTKSLVQATSETHNF
ncbi:O-methylsterigmatocystin oxidoreductase [Mycena sanguinolenta]|uniref:O-methylsterigmatocystin oxidoreductase n=1 Tax=Mycena sanguinolenta TaxID=230812 RepID=A0A8H6XU21_9AGAR|nr:O-methylsterigmatocystin oxidoreductase [Mycena sanguinolenta]